MAFDIKGLTAFSAKIDELPPVDRLHQLAGLAGNRVAGQLALLRARQARLEADRLERAEGQQSERVLLARKTAEAAKLQVAAIGEESMRLKLKPPQPAKGEAAAYGYVRQAGKPAKSLTVELQQDDGKVAVSTTTGDDGAFSLSVASEVALKLAVRKGDAKLYTDKAALIDAGPIAKFRMIDLPAAKGGGKKKPKEDVSKRETDGRFGRLVGQPLDQALAWLREYDFRLGRVAVTSDGGQDGRVFKAQEAEDGARLWVSVADRDAGGLETLAVMVAHSPEAADIGLGKPEAARGALYALEAKSLDDAKKLLTLSNRDFATKSGLNDVKRGSALKKALKSSFKMIEVE